MTRILIADDSNTCSFILSVLLSNQGYYVTVAEDGEKALALLENTRYDLAILDHDMPKVSGLEVLRYIRGHHDCPVIVVSGSISEKERRQYEDLKVIGIHGKPTDPKRLNDQINALFPSTVRLVRESVRYASVIGPRTAKFVPAIKRLHSEEDIVSAKLITAEQLNSGKAFLDVNTVNIVQFADDLTTAGQKNLEKAMVGARVVLCSTKSIDDLEDAGFSPALVMRFGIKSLPVS